MPRLSAAPGLLLLVVAGAALAGPPGVQLSNLELAASSTAERSSQIADGGQDLTQAVSYRAAGIHETRVQRNSAPVRDDGDGDDDGESGQTSLQDLVIEFLENL